MLKAAREKLEDVIVSILSHHAAIAADDLFSELKRRKLTYTLQALYKELRKLQKLGVVVKGRGLYSLRLAWILSLTDLADRAYAAYIDAPLPHELLPESEKRFRWTFTNPVRADDFYMQILTKILMRPEVKAAWTVLEHPWFLFVSAHMEQKHQEILKQQRKRHFMVVENDTPLDRAQMHIYDGIWARGSVTDELNICTTYSIVSAVGEYVLSEKLPVAARKGFSRIYSETRSIKNLNFKTISALCNTPGTSSVVLERNPEKSRQLIKKMEQFF